jgi:hypothetical protein
VAALVAYRDAADAAAARVESAGGRRRFRATAVKIMMDGVCESFTAAMHEPYLSPGGPSANGGLGITYLEPALLTDAVVACDSAGFVVHVHAIGDGAVSQTLDAFGAARAASGRTDLPHQIAHLQVVRADDVQRWARARVWANMQALWACHEPQMDELTIPFLGPDRSRRQYPFGELHAAGVPLAMGSDWPVSSADPLAAIHVAVTRVAPTALRQGETRPPFLPEQCLDVLTALRAYTSGSADASRLDGAGRIRVGARADLAVIDRDLLADPESIDGAAVDLTLVDGDVVFERRPSPR